MTDIILSGVDDRHHRDAEGERLLLEWWWARTIQFFPRLLLATLAYLLEWIVRRSQATQRGRRRPPLANDSFHRDRILVQVLLWLMASLPSPSSISSPLTTEKNHTDTHQNNHNYSLLFLAMMEGILHALFFFNLVAIAVQIVRARDKLPSIQTTALLGRKKSFWNARALCWGCYCPKASATRNNTTFLQQPGGGWSWLEMFFENLSFSLWVTLIFAYLDMAFRQRRLAALEHNGGVKDIYWYVSMAGAIFVLSFILPWAVKLKTTTCSCIPARQSQQHYQYHHQMQQQDPSISSSTATVTSESNVQNHLDEANWHLWTVPQVLEWMSCTYLQSIRRQVSSSSSAFVTMNTHSASLAAAESENEDEEGDDVFYTLVLPRMAFERIDGAALEYLNLEALRHMDVPYGTAAPLLAQIESRLTQRYPKRRPDNALSDRYSASSNHSHNDGLPTTSYFADNEFGTTVNGGSRHHREPYMTEDELEQMRETMKNRYGLELPELSPSNGSLTHSSNTRGFDSNNNLEPKDPHQFLLAMPGPINKAPEEQSGEILSLDNGYTDRCNDADPKLQTMPPEIRDIVNRKPHLWQKVQQMQANETHNPSAAEVFERQQQQQDEETESQMQPLLGSSRLGVASGQLGQLVPQSATSTSIGPDMLQNLPPKIKEVALRNPELFRQMLIAKEMQQTNRLHHGELAPINEDSSADSGVDKQTNGNEEMIELLPRKSYGGNRNLRQRPGL